MKVYVPVIGYRWEGYNEPLGVFTTLEAAKAAIGRAPYSGDDQDIFEYEVDGTEDGLKIKDTQ